MNPFAVLQLPERASLSSEAIKESFQQLSARHHPDRRNYKPSGDHEPFTEINEAYRQVRSPGGRLKALLQQRFGESFELKGSLPEGLIDLFSRVGPALQEADRFLAKKARSTTNLAQALLTPELIQTQKRLTGASAQVQTRLDALEAQLPEIDAALAGEGAAKALAPASVLCREALYLEKWHAQIQERFHQLL